jgi:uncharacterized protein (TIGR03032 family)
MTFAKDGEVLRDPAEIVAHWDAAGNLDSHRLDHRATAEWWDLIESLGITLLVTREYEHLVIAMSGRGRMSYLRLPHPSGIVVDRSAGTVYVAATRNPNQVIGLAPVEPGGYIVPGRSAFYPGSLYLHDIAVIHRRLYANAVGQNTLVEFRPDGSYRRVWWPASLDPLGESRFTTNYLQVNSIAANGSISDSYVSASAASPGRRRPGHVDFPIDRRGVIFSVATRKPVAGGLTRPHSARMHRGRIWVDDSGYGRVGYVESGGFHPVAQLPGWTRGLCFVKNIAFVGTSRVIPKFARYAPGVREAICGIHALDVQSGSVVASIVWPHGNQVFGIDWCPSALTSGFPFSRGRREIRLKGTRELFFNYQFTRRPRWLI